MAYQEEQDTQFTPIASLINNLVSKYKSLAYSLRRALHELAKANDN